MPFSRSRNELRIQYLRSTGIHTININMGINLSPAHLVYTLESCLILFIKSKDTRTIALSRETEKTQSVTIRLFIL